MPHIYSIEEIRDIITPVARSYEVERVFLFGSYARGEATPKSDIDLRIDCGGIRDLFQLGGFYQDIADNFSVSVDVLTTGGLSAKFLNRIKGEEVILYEQ